MKLYTKTGDLGETGLFGGVRVSKAALRVDAYGEVDELNAALGLVVTVCRPVLAPPGRSEGPTREVNSGSAAGADAWSLIADAMLEIQSRLFDLGSDLATPIDSSGREYIVPVPASAVERLEGWIDAAEDRLPPLRNFILPGGTELAARLHLARTVCRRAERAVVRLRDAFVAIEPTAAGAAGSPGVARTGETAAAVGPSDHAAALAGPIVYLNRLSDLLFAFARLANLEAGVADIAWRSPRRSTDDDTAADGSA